MLEKYVYTCKSPFLLCRQLGWVKPLFTTHTSPCFRVNKESILTTRGKVSLRWTQNVLSLKTAGKRGNTRDLLSEVQRAGSVSSVTAQTCGIFQLLAQGDGGNLYLKLSFQQNPSPWGLTSLLCVNSQLEPHPASARIPCHLVPMPSPALLTVN